MDVDAPRPIDPDAVARPVLRASATDAPVIVDGVLDESIWMRADSATDFVTALPRDGFPASERSVVRVVFDDRTLYVGAYLYDSQPDRLYSPGLEQDFATHDADMFGVVIDANLDRQSAVLFGVSPVGAVFDAQAFNDSRYVNTAWEGVVEVHTAVHADGWSAEIAIPFTTLRFPPGDGPRDWGLNFVRRIRRINEDSYWAPLARQFRLHKMSRAGTLSGVRVASGGRNLVVKPYVSASTLDGRVREDLDEVGTDFDAGFDLKLGVGPRLTLDVSALTDFSQVEVDQEQVNLTRFSLFFPEKRDFFLENDGVFTLGDVTERNYRTGSGPRDFKLFYSRSVGLSDDRRPIPIAGGVRLSGTIGSTEIGVLDMQTRGLDGVAPAENFAVVRLRQNLGSTADIGVMAINRQVTESGFAGDYNRSYGVDANARLFRHLLVNSYFALTDSPGPEGDRTAGYVQLAWRDPVWDVSGFVKRVGEDFDPRTGFIVRRGIRQLFATVGAHPQPGLRGVAEVNPYVDVSAIETLEGRLESRELRSGLATTFVDGAVLTFEVEDNFERLFDTTPIVGVPLGAGGYDFRSVRGSYRSSGARRLSGTLSVQRGSFYDGDRTSVSASAVWRPDPRWSLDLFAQHNDLQLGDRALTSDVFGGRVSYAHSTRLFSSAFVQYLEATDELVANLRFNLIHAPLSDLFLVLTERRQLGSEELVDRFITLKVTKLLAF